MKTPKAVLLVSCFLLVAVLAVFGRTLGHGFVNLDNDQYVYRNPHVIGGLSGQDVVWAFTHFMPTTGTRSPGSRTCSTAKSMGWSTPAAIT